MLKTIGRILIILAVAGIVAGGVYALVQNSGTGNTSFDSRDRFASQPTGSGQLFQSPPREFEDHDRREASLGRGIVGIFGTTLEIGAITLAVVIIQNAFSARKIKVRTG